MRFLRSALAASFLGLTLSVGLVTTTAVRADALVPPIDLGKVVTKVAPVVIGAGKGVSLLGRGTPVGMVLTAGQAAWWAYSEFGSSADLKPGDDYPTTLEEFCAANPSCVPPTGTGPSTWSDTRTQATIGGVGTNSLTLNLSALSCPNGCANFGVTFTTAGNVGTTTQQANRGVHCKRPDGTEYVRNSSGFADPISVTLGRTNLGGSMTGTMTFQCLAGETVTGLLVLPVANPGSSGQSYVVEWGRPVTYPDGEVTFEEMLVTAKCRNAVTGDTTTIKARSDYNAGSIMMPSCKEHLGDDWYGTGFTVAPTKPRIDGEPIPDDVEWDVPDFLPYEWDEELPDEEDPDWQPCHGTKKGCSLSLWLDDNPVGTKVDVRVITEILDKQPNRLKCYWGSKTVDLKNCYPLLNELKNLQDGKETVLDPGTGTPTTPGTGTGAPAPRLPEDGPEQTECFPKGWGLFNPFEWVYKPVKCALKWAFVPPTSFQTRLTRIKTAIEGRAPFSWFASMATIPATIGGGGGCPNWVFSFKGESYNVLCGTAMGDGLRAFRPVLTVLVLGAAVYPFMRSLVYAGVPIIKPKPSD